jgi:hypothetical protein
MQQQLMGTPAVAALTNTWVRCVQAVTAVGQEVAAQCKDQDAPNHLEAELQQLLASLVAAAHLSGLAGLPKQVRACNMAHALPNTDTDARFTGSRTLPLTSS